MELTMRIFDLMVRVGWKILSRQKKLGYRLSSLYSSVQYLLSLPSYYRSTRRYRLGKKSIEGPLGANIAGYFTMESGMGESARSLVRIFEKTEVPFLLNNVEDSLNAGTNTTYTHLFQRDNPYNINIIDINANEIPAAIKKLSPNSLFNKYNIAFWVWELESFPQKWSPSFTCFDELWSPSAFSARAIQARTSLPVTIMPHAIHIDHIDKAYSRNDFGLHPNSFVFLFVFSLQSAFERKNPHAVITAFRKAFRGFDGKKVNLVLKISGTSRHRWAYDEILKAGQGLPLTIIDYPVTSGALYRLMSLADCYVSLHRSEGFGLTMAEAMFLGKPCIATAYSGNMDFMNEDNSFPVNYTMKKIETSVGPYKNGNEWADADINHAADLMRFVYEHRDAAATIGMRGAHTIREKFSPQAIASILENRIMEIHGEKRL